MAESFLPCMFTLGTVRLVWGAKPYPQGRLEPTDDNRPAGGLPTESVQITSLIRCCLQRKTDLMEGRVCCHLTSAVCFSPSPVEFSPKSKHLRMSWYMRTQRTVSNEGTPRWGWIGSRKCSLFYLPKGEKPVFGESKAVVVNLSNATTL